VLSPSWGSKQVRAPGKTIPFATTSRTSSTYALSLFLNMALLEPLEAPLEEELVDAPSEEELVDASSEKELVDTPSLKGLVVADTTSALGP